MKRIVVLLVIILFFLTTIQHSNAQTPQSTDYPEFLEVKLPYINTSYLLTPSTNNITLQRTFQITEFRDVTFADVFISQSGSHISSVSISLKLNGVNATTVHNESSLLDQEPLFFVLDDHAMILPKESNILTFVLTVSFSKPNAWDLQKDQFYWLRFDSITIKTVYRQQVNASTKQLNQNNSRFTALIIDPYYEFASQGSQTGNKSKFLTLYTYDLEFYLVLPKEIKSNYLINLTFSYDFNIEIRRIFIDNFGLVSSWQTDTVMSYVFRYLTDKDTGSLSKGIFSFRPKAEGSYNLQLQGFFFITDNYKLFPGGPEMDFFLFVNATIIIPLLMLSKLIYRRLFY